MNEGQEKRRLTSVFSRLLYQTMTEDQDQRMKLSIEHDGGGGLRRWKTEGNIICLALVSS